MPRLVNVNLRSTWTDIKRKDGKDLWKIGSKRKRVKSERSESDEPSSKNIKREPGLALSPLEQLDHNLLEAIDCAKRISAHEKSEKALVNAVISKAEQIISLLTPKMGPNTEAESGIGLETESFGQNSEPGSGPVISIDSF